MATAIPGHGSGGSTGASVPNGISAPPSSMARNGKRLVGPNSPGLALLRRVTAQVNRLD